MDDGGDGGGADQRSTSQQSQSLVEEEEEAAAATFVVLLGTHLTPHVPTSWAPSPLSQSVSQFKSAIPFGKKGKILICNLQRCLVQIQRVRHYFVVHALE